MTGGLFIPTLSKPIDLATASPVFANWIQTQLARGGYLSLSAIDGKVGAQTLKAFAEFKEDVYLSEPRSIGQSSINLLAKLQSPHPVSEQGKDTVSNFDSIGSKTGRSETLPLVGLVFANERINFKVPLSWGEVTMGLTRIPADGDVVRSLQRLAIAFGKVRDKAGTALNVTSGYRPPAVNRAVGGAKNSFHVRGQALDLIPADGDYRKLTDAMKTVDEIGEIGIARSFRHMAIGGGREIFRYGNK